MVKLQNVYERTIPEFLSLRCIQRFASPSCFRTQLAIRIVCCGKLLSEIVFTISLFAGLAYSQSDNYNVHLKMTDIPIKLKLPVTLLPGHEYTVPLSLTSSLNSNVILSSVKSSCGCLVANVEAAVLVPGESTKISLKIQTGPMEKGQFAKLLSFRTVNEEVVAVEVIADVIPFVSCKSIDFDQAMLKPGKIVFSFLRKEATAHDFKFEPPSNSHFEWHGLSSKADELTVSIAPVGRKTNSSVLAEEWCEYCRFVPRDSKIATEAVSVPVVFRLPRKPTILPFKLMTLENDEVSFCIVGDIDINATTMHLYCDGNPVEFVCHTRSKRVHVVKVFLNKHNTTLKSNPKELRIVVSAHLPGLDVVLPITPRER